MKVSAECVSCLVERAKYECDIVFQSDLEKLRALKAFLRLLSANLSESRTPSFYGTERERLVKRLSGVRDPYRELKREANALAKTLLPVAEAFYRDAEDKMEALVRVAAVANAIEYGVKGYSFSTNAFKANFLSMLRNEKLNWEREAVENAIEEHDAILYLTDNAGEVFFDAFVVGEFLKRGKFVVISPKSEPVLNDATVEDLKDALSFVGIPTTSTASTVPTAPTTSTALTVPTAPTAPTSSTNLADAIEKSEEKTKAGAVSILPSGAYVGVSLEEAPSSFLSVLRDERFLVVAKGMGHYEALSEIESAFKGRLLYILKAKCEPVAESIGVKRGELVAKCI